MADEGAREAGAGPRPLGVAVLAAAGLFLVGWWWLDRQGSYRSDEAKLVLGSIWSAILLVGVMLGYGRR